MFYKVHFSSFHLKYLLSSFFPSLTPQRRPLYFVWISVSSFAAAPPSSPYILWISVSSYVAGCPLNLFSWKRNRKQVVYTRSCWKGCCTHSRLKFFHNLWINNAIQRKDAVWIKYETLAKPKDKRCLRRIAANDG